MTPDAYVRMIKENWPNLQVEGTIGKGSFGCVYECVKKGDISGLEEREALKVVEISLTESDLRQYMRMELDPAEEYRGKRERAIQEVVRMVQLKSPHVVHINDYKVIEDSTQPYCTCILIRMDLMSGLTKMRKAHETDSKEQAEAFARKICLDVCEALIYCSEKGIIHRDIKPENILVSESGDFYLADFGISRELHSELNSMTSTGTEMYMAPEVQTHRYDGRADIYSLGLILYEIVNHWRVPFVPFYPKSLTRENYFTAFAKRQQGEPLPRPDNCSAEFARMICKMCAFKPEDRFDTAAEVKAAMLRQGTVPSDNGRKHESIGEIGFNERFYKEGKFSSAKQKERKEEEFLPLAKDLQKTKNVSAAHAGDPEIYVRKDAKNLIVQVQWTGQQKVRARDLEAFSGKAACGFLTPRIVHEKQVEYSGPSCVGWAEYIANPPHRLDSKSFYRFVNQIVDAEKKLRMENLSAGDLLLHPEYTFVEKETEELWFVYLPDIYVEGSLDFIGALRFLTKAFLAGETGGKDYLLEMLLLLDRLDGHNIQEIEKHLTETGNRLHGRASNNDGFLTNKIRDYYEHYHDSHDEKEPENTFSDNEGTSLLTDVEETVLLGGENINNVRVPILIRTLTGERVRINKPVFRIGKEQRYVDYYIADNPAISRSHADIICRKGCYYVMDLNSKNRTFVNNRVIQPNVETRLYDGDEIFFANESFEFHFSR